MSPILVTLTSRSDSDFERSNVSLKEDEPNGVNPNSNDIDYYARKNEGKITVFGRLYFASLSKGVKVSVGIQKKAPTNVFIINS